SEEGKPRLRLRAGSNRQAQAVLGGLCCQQVRRDYAELIYIWRVHGGGDRDTGAWSKCASLRQSQSVRRNLQGGCCLPAQPWGSQAVFLFGRITCRGMSSVEKRQHRLEKRKDAPADRRLGGRQRLRDCVRH